MARTDRQTAQKTAKPRPARPAAAPPRLAQKRTPWWQSPWLIGGGGAAVVVVVVLVIVLGSRGPGNNGGTPTPNPTPDAAVLAAVTQPSASLLEKVGVGSSSSSLQRTPNTTPPTKGSGGKPSIIYVGAEFCPYCAAERWSMIIALSRFGSFANLHLTESSSTDVFPDTPTFTFHGVTYSSQYVDFQFSEIEDRNKQPLDTPTAAVNSTFLTFDQAPYTQQKQSFPFVDFGDHFILIGAGYNPSTLAGLSWDQIASDLSAGTAPEATAILQQANWLTAATCSVTSDQPATVCTPAIKAIESKLPTQPPTAPPAP